MHFHSIVLLVKMLLNHRRNPENVLAAELYEEVVAGASPSRVAGVRPPPDVGRRAAQREAADNGGEW